MTSSIPLTSIVIPAYKSCYFAQALDSALAQTWPSLEIVVCDDSADDGIANIVEARASCTGIPIHYYRNEVRAGEHGSTLRGIKAAKGAYIKFLHDDDILEPGCVAALVAVMQSNPQVSLAASRRRRIGPLGRWLPDIGATSPLFSCDVVIDGSSLVAFLAEHTVNFIGEPSCVMCRRNDLLDLDDDLMSLAGKPIHWVGDLALYAKLLRRGDLALLAAPLARFRVSAQQFSQIGRDLPGIGEQGHADFRNGILSLGWHHPDGGEACNQLLVAALGTNEPPQLVDLQLRLEQVFAHARTNLLLHDWQAARTHAPNQAALFDAVMAPLSRLGIVIDVTDGCSNDDLLNTLTELPLPEALRNRVDFKVIGGLIPPSLRQLFPAQTSPSGDSHINALNSAISTWDVDWIIRLDAGTDFCVGGLSMLLWTLAQATDCQQAISADEWLRGSDGQTTPVLRPAFDVDLLMGNPETFSRHWVFRRSAVLSAGGFDPSAGGAAELAMLLAIFRDRSVDAFVHLAEPLLISTPHHLEVEAVQEVVSAHLRCSGFPAAEVGSAAPGLFHIAYGATPAVLTSIIIVATADTDIAMLERCVVSLIEKTTAPFELLLIDNGSPAATGRWIGQIEALGQGQIHAYSLQPPLSRVAANNLGAREANGDYLLFLRPETAILQPQWLDALLDQAQRAGVGIVGALTVSGEGLITHAGLVPGCLSNGGRVFAGQNMGAEGYLQRLRLTQRYAAVADSCLLVSRENFDALNGFDHSVFDNEGADVDFCLRANANGLTTIWTPHARLLHSIENSAMAPSVQDTLFERWLPEIANDNAYNPNLRLDVDGGFRLGESDFSWKPLPWQPLPRLLAQPADPWGSGQYRVIQPFKALKQGARIEGALYSTLLDPVEQARIDPDVVILQRRVSEDDLHKIQRGARFSRALKVYELDDYLPNLPAKSAHREHMPRDVLRSLRKAMGLVDRFVVSTPAMAEAFAGLHPDIRIARNRLPVSWWKHLPAVRRDDSSRPRVGWAGGVGHTGDLEMIADVVSELAQEVDWVFFGMCPDRLRPYVAEFHPGVDIALYPRALAQLQLDLAIAPLEENRFNECKSNLRLLEYGACAVPVVCSDVGPYRDPNLPVTRVRNRHREWVGAIREHLADADARRLAGDALKSVVHRDWMLEGAGLDEWRAAWLP